MICYYSSIPGFNTGLFNFSWSQWKNFAFILVVYFDALSSSLGTFAFTVFVKSSNFQAPFSTTPYAKQEAVASPRKVSSMVFIREAKSRRSNLVDFALPPLTAKLDNESSFLKLSCPRWKKSAGCIRSCSASYLPGPVSWLVQQWGG